MDLEFFSIMLPNYLGSNTMYCPIDYCLKKHNCNLIIPRPFTCEKNKYIVCVPSLKYVEVMRKFEDYEDCKITWMKTQHTTINNLTNTYVIKNGNEYIVTKKI